MLLALSFFVWKRFAILFIYKFFNSNAVIINTSFTGLGLFSACVLISAGIELIFLPLAGPDPVKETLSPCWRQSPENPW